MKRKPTFAECKENRRRNAGTGRAGYKTAAGMAARVLPGGDQKRKRMPKLESEHAPEFCGMVSIPVVTAQVPVPGRSSRLRGGE